MGKIIPPGVEASMFSLTTTLIGLSVFILRQFVGTIVNDLFVGVTNDSLNKYYILTIIEGLSRLVPLMLIFRLVPTNAEINQLQAVNIEKSKKANMI